MTVAWHLPSDDGESRLPCPVMRVFDLTIANFQVHAWTKNVSPERLPEYGGDPT